MKAVLLVAYGSGHIKMIVPVAQALAASGLVRPVVLALTTAALVTRAAGLEVVQFKDFATPDDASALEHGRQLMADLGGDVVDADETAAYLGLSYADLVESLGAAGAAAAYAQRGRQSFLPLGTMRRVLAQLQPDLVVATNSPRAERAAIVAAGEAGIPSVCLVDLFAIDEVKWIGEPNYADRVCVLNESVRRFLIDSGRRPEQVIVTGNPGFDALNQVETRDAGQALRLAHGWAGKKVILWPNQVEPAIHPFAQRRGDPGLPGRVLQRLSAWVLSQPDVVLCIRARAGEAPTLGDANPRTVMTGQDWPLAPLLHAVDLVVTLNSTVGLEGHLAGCRLIQVLGSVFDEAMPLARYGIADEAVQEVALVKALQTWIAAPRRPTVNGDAAATQRVIDVLAGFL